MIMIELKTTFVLTPVLLTPVLPTSDMEVVKIIQGTVPMIQLDKQ